jgi:PleD family two-component response regulator
MSEAKPTILVVEDDVDVADMLNAYFRVQGYDVVAVNWGEDAVKACRTSRPDLVILDIRLPDIDGYEVARRLRTSRRTEDIPIIFLTEKRERTDRLQGLELGADDYITKPFDIQELRLRVRNALRRSSVPSNTNPVTGLAEGALVDERLRECLESDGWAVLMIGLEHLDDFREAYGFVASDDVQRAIALIIHNALRGAGSSNDFLGQFSPTEFVLVTSPGSVPALVERIRSRLGQSLDYFYPLKDRTADAPAAGRLTVWISQLLPSYGPFEDLEAFKVEMAKHKI